MISYAQNFEDIMLWRALKNVKNGFYVDVGAGRPELDSVTKHFYEQGWHGINIEPHLEDFPLLAAARPRDVNLNIAIGPQKGAMTFYQNKIRGWSTLDQGTATEMLGLGGESLEVQVECLPLQEVLDQYSDGPIHFLKIDVEGYEEEVLKSIDLKKSRPWIVVLEAADIHARLPDPAKSFLQLGKNGYEFVYTDALNFFYISLEKLEELKPHFQQPPNIFDGFVHLNSRDPQQTAQFEDLRKLVSEGQASVEALKVENLTLAQQRKAQQEEVAKSVGGLKEELAQQRKAQQEEVAKSVGGLKEELAQQRKAQQEAVATSIGGLKEELAQQRKAQQEAVEKSVGGLKEELAQQRKAQQEAVERSVGEVKREIVAEIHSLIANLGEQAEKNRLAVSARIDSVEEGMEGMEGRIVETAEYATKIQEAMVSPSSYLIPAPFSWYSYLYKMLNIRKPNWINKKKRSVEAPKRPGFLRRLERSVRKRRKRLFGRIGFDRKWYLQEYPEVGPSGIDPLDHYLLYGLREGRWKSKAEKLREPIFIPHQLKRGSRNLKRVLRDAALLITCNPEKWAKIKKSITKKSEKFYKLFFKEEKEIGNQFIQNQLFDQQTDFKQEIIFYIDHTWFYQGTSGVQRVVRKAAQKILKKNPSTIFIIWDETLLKLLVLDPCVIKPFIDTATVCLDKNIYEKGLISLEEYLNKKSSSKQNVNWWLFVPEIPWMSRAKKDLTFQLIENAKKLKLKTAFIFYDLIPINHRAYSTDAQQHATYSSSLIHADVVFPISKNSEKEILDFWQETLGSCLPSKPKVLTLELPGNFLDLPQSKVHNVSPDNIRYIICVGSITPHKNQLLLLRAFNELCDEKKLANQIFLKFVGHIHRDIVNEFNTLLRSNPKVHQVANLTDEELTRLYQGSLFSVFPSLHEGYGLPIIESLFHGKPCLCSNNSPMKEIADGGGCMAINFEDLEKIKSALLDLTNIDNDTLKRLSNEVKNRHFSSWDDYANKLLDHMDQFSKGKNILGNIYYWVDHTCSYPSNSGIQRVVRCLARALIENGYRLIPIKWDSQNHKFYSPKKSELNHLSEWNGPSVKSWGEWVPLHAAGMNDIFLVPELTTYLPSNALTKALEIIRLYDIKSAIIFYDALPWRLKNIYPYPATAAHEEYMQNLNLFDQVLCISKHSKNELIEYWVQCDKRIVFAKDQIVDCCLPGEFPESSRNHNLCNLKNPVKTILCVGTVEPRKNHLNLLKAFQILQNKYNKKIELILLGGAPFPDLTKKIEQIIKNQPSIKWEKDASDFRLKQLYDKCLFTVYPSLDEGFGLPILESLWYGRPCICRNASSMAEIAPGGGVVTVDTTSPELLAHAMHLLLVDKEYYKKVAESATARPLKSWNDYALQLACSLSQLVQKNPRTRVSSAEQKQKKARLSSEISKNRPVLSLCVTTYNREGWCKKTIENIITIWPEENPQVEIIICDNASSDNTGKIVTSLISSRKDFRYFRNEKNVGMLGNLGKTVMHSSGKFVWLVGDDDLLFPGSIQKVLSIIEKNPDLALIYLNYSYTSIDEPNLVQNWSEFFKTSKPIVQSSADKKGLIKEICAQNENFFTGIYSMILTRYHAVKAYNQNMDGEPFSELKNCVPSTLYVLSNMMNLTGYWVCEPQIVVNMNVSWLRYAPLWILERIPEVYDLAEVNGGSRSEIDKWRNQNLPGINHFLADSIKNNRTDIIESIVPEIMLKRIRHLDQYPNIRHLLMKACENSAYLHKSKSPLIF